MSGNNWSHWSSQNQHSQGFYNFPQQSHMDYQHQTGQRAVQRPGTQRLPNEGNYSTSQNYQNTTQYQNQHHQSPYTNQSMHPNYMMMHHQQTHQQPFMFNANANVFVPRTAQSQSIQNHPCYSMQHSQNYYGPQSGSSQFPPNFCPASTFNAMFSQEDTGVDAFAQFGQQAQQYMPSKELYEQMVRSNSSSLLSEIQVGCEQLISEGEEDSSTWTAAIRQRFEDQKMSDESKRIGVKLIVEMAFSMEPNQFRGTDPQFTFSNLLKTLSFELKDFMRRIVLPVLNEFHDFRRHLENDSRVFMAVFYAETFVKLTLENGSRFEKLGEALADQIDEILKFSPKDDYMKCLLRAFKVSGAELDSSENLRKRVDQILTTMGAFANGSPVLGESIKAQILSLIECRQRGWDRVPSGTGTASFSKLDQDSFDESTDNDLTEEERQFLESHLEQAGNQDGEDDIDEQEVMNEFGKFVKEELWRAEEMKTTDMMKNMSVNNPDSTN